MRAEMSKTKNNKIRVFDRFEAFGALSYSNP